MPVSVTHQKVSSVPDSGDSTVVQPSDWNATHTLTGLGTAAELDVGTGALNIVQLDGDGKLPAVDGSQLTGIVTGGTPGGSDTQIQFNDGGSFGGDSGFTFNKTTKAVTLGGATVTTSAPVLDLAQTWNASGTTFTGLKFNVTNTASAAGSLLMDLQFGSSSRFSVARFSVVAGGGAFRTSISTTSTENGLTGYDGLNNARIKLGYDSNGSGGFPSILMSSVGAYLFNSVSTINNTPDTFLTRRAAANLRLGAADAAAPVAQTLSVQSVVAGTSNTAGANFTITGSQGTGTGAGGSIVFQVAPAGSSGTAQNALADALTITSAKEVKCAGPLWVSNAYQAGAPTATGYIVLYDSTGTAYKIAAEAL